MSLLQGLNDIAYAAGESAQQPSMWELLVLPISFFVIFYFLLIRPQHKKQRAQQDMLENLKSGDEVVTSGGIIAKVKSVSDSFVTVDPGSSQYLKIKKGHIAGLTKPMNVAKPAKPQGSKDKAQKSK